MMDTRDLAARLMPTPFFSSFAGRAHAGDRFTADLTLRSAAWAHWAVTATAEMTGFAERSYLALTLPGRFYDPKGTGPSVCPHLEIPTRTLSRPDPSFPERLALLGNATAFPWFVVSEIKAMRRALFPHRIGDLSPAAALLAAHRTALADAVEELSCAARPRWDAVEHLLVTEPESLVDAVTGDVTADEVADFFPAADLPLRAVFDQGLKDASARWAPRRLGVWHLTAGTGKDSVPFAALTPRLTANSMFTDPLFQPDRESPASLLVRGLILRRILRTFLGLPDSPTVAVGPDARDPAHLRIIVAHVGHKLPEASTSAAAHFLQRHPEPGPAWDQLRAWATGKGLALMADPTTFTAAHERAATSLRRAEDPDREDINHVLPLAWDSRARVVRVTYTRAAKP